MKIAMDRKLRQAAEELAPAFKTDSEDDERDAIMLALIELARIGEAERCIGQDRIAWRATDKLLKRLAEEEQESTAEDDLA